MVQVTQMRRTLASSP